jgi:hypothetical protein
MFDLGEFNIAKAAAPGGATAGYNFRHNSSR